MLKPENLLLSFSSVARSFLGFSQKKNKIKIMSFTLNVSQARKS